MIAPQGFTVLADYAVDISDAVSEIFEREDGTPDYLPSFPLQELSEHVLLGAFIDCRELWLFSAQGALHKVSRKVYSVMFGRDELLRKRTTFCLFNFSDFRIDSTKVENATLPFDDPKRVTRFHEDKILVEAQQYNLDLANSFAEFDGYFLCVPDGVLPPADKLRPISMLREGEQQLSAEYDVGQVEALLRAAVKEGLLPHRDSFKRQYAPDMKVEAFRAVWRSVATDFPDLSRPGPKPTPRSKR